jgi:aquaporin related protein
MVLFPVSNYFLLIESCSLRLLSVTGGVFNPNVSTGLLLIGAIGPVRWALYCVAELAGGIAAAALILALVPGPLVVT